MAPMDFNVSSRQSSGKGISRSLRRQGLIPAVMYGRGTEPCALAVDPKALKQAISGEAGWNTLLALKGDGAFDGKVVILKELQTDPVKMVPIHADFQAIDLASKVHVMVPVHAVGKAAGVKEGGVLQVIRHELEVVCLPHQIPTAIEIDVTALAIGDALHVKNVVLPVGVELPPDVNFTVITVTGRGGADETAAEGEAE